MARSHRWSAWPVLARAFAVVLVSTAITVACTAPPPVAPTPTPTSAVEPLDAAPTPMIEPLPLVGPTWQVTAYNNGKGEAVSLLPGTALSLTFDSEGQLAGAAGCNTYRASYQAESPAVTIGPPVATRKTCAEPAGIMEQEAAYLAVLSTTAAYNVIGDQLTLRDAQGAIVLEAVAPLDGNDPAPPGGAAPAASAAPSASATPELTGPAWQWLQTQSGDGTLLVIHAPERYTVQFVPDGTVAVQADCNSGSGTYTAEGSSLRIAVKTLTQMACPPGSLSEKFVASLNAAGTYVFADGNLFINMQMDSGDMKFAAAGGQ
jgi:heat shock protein HslJ